jgi:hypothetical protein
MADPGKEVTMPKASEHPALSEAPFASSPLWPVLNFARVRPGIYLAFGSSGKPVRCTITRHLSDWWGIEWERWDGRDWGAIDTGVVRRLKAEKWRSLKTAMRRCEQVAWEDGMLAGVIMAPPVVAAATSKPRKRNRFFSAETVEARNTPYRARRSIRVRALPLVLVFSREKPGRYVSTSNGERLIHWTVTRLHGCDRWEVERVHRDGGRWIVFDTHMAHSLAAGMRWCEDAARNDGLLPSLATPCRPADRAAVGMDFSHLPGAEG